MEHGRWLIAECYLSVEKRGSCNGALVTAFEGS